jgi:hypothetical protein
MSELPRELLTFLREVHITPKSAWFDLGEFDVYIRAGKYHLDVETHEFQNAVGIANISSDAPPTKGKFKEFIIAFEIQCAAFGYHVVRFEQVLNDKLKDNLIKNGYIQYGRKTDDLNSLSYIKLLETTMKGQSAHTLGVKQLVFLSKLMEHDHAVVVVKDHINSLATQFPDINMTMDVAPVTQESDFTYVYVDYFGIDDEALLRLVAYYATISNIRLHCPDGNLVIGWQVLGLLRSHASTQLNFYEGIARARSLDRTDVLKQAKERINLLVQIGE